MQIFQYKKYVNLSNFNRYRITFVPALRGNILDRKGVKLAYNQLSYKATFNPALAKDKASVIREFFKLTERKERFDVEKFIQDSLKRIKIYNTVNPLILKKILTYDEVVRIEFNIEYLPGVSIERSDIRVYPLGESAVYLTGYVAKPTQNQIESANQLEKKLFKESDFKIGKAGTEMAKEESIRGSFGIVLKEVNSVGEIVQRIDHREPVNGDDVALTVDAALQKEVAGIINDIPGTMIVSRLSNSQILAMHSSPSYDPNEIISGIDTGIIKKARDQKTGQWMNRSIYGNYQPGSIFKPISVLTALINGWDHNKTIYCNGEFVYGNRIFHCHNKSGHGHMSLTEAIGCSCNVYFFHMSQKIYIDQIHSVATEFGFGLPVNLGIGKESLGLVPNGAWKEKNLKKKWLPSETMMVAIGQSYLQATLMQMHNMTSQIASGFKAKSKIFLSENNNHREPVSISEYYLGIIRDGLRLSFSHAQGSSRGSIETDKKYSLAGKTGTAQVISKRISIEEMLSGSVPKNQMPHALFSGYFPYENPKFAITTMIEHGMSGSIAARYAKLAIKKTIDLIED